MLKGTAWAKKYEEREFADFYRAGSLKLVDRTYEKLEAESPPWIMVPPSICYGPKTCKYYKMGRPRSVTYKNRDSVLDE